MKAKPYWDLPQTLEAGMEQGPAQVQALGLSHPALDPIAAFSTVGQPVSDTILKDMLLFLRSFLHSDMLDCMKQIKQEIHSLEDRIDTVESSLGI